MSQIAEITHEGGDLSEYDSTETGSGDLSAAAGAALAGTSYGLQSVVDDTSAIWAQLDISPTIGHIRQRLYIDPNSIDASNVGDYLQFWRVYNGSDQAGILYLGGPGTSDYQIILYAISDTGSWKLVATANITDEPHYVEIEIEEASGVGNDDGTAELWVDGVSIGSRSDLDNDTRASAMSRIRVGAVGDIVDISGTFYIDEIVIRDDGQEIGPRVGLLPLAAHHYRLRRV